MGVRFDKGVGGFVSSIMGSDNDYHMEERKVDPNSYNYGGQPGGADAAANRYQATAEAAQNRTGPRANYDQANYDRDQARNARNSQAQMAGLMEARARGQVPSIAQMQADRQMGQAAAAQASAAASARGPAALALAQQQAANNTANAQSDISGQAQINAANERMQAEQAAMGAFSQMRGQDYQSMGLNAQMDQFNTNMEMQQRGLNDAMTQGMTANEIAVRNAQLTAGMNKEAQQSGNFNNANAVNAGVSGQNSGTNANMGMGAVNMSASIAGALGSGGGPDKKAAGGPVLQAKPYLVGEKGPELVVPTSPGYVIPADQTRKLLAPSKREDGGPVGPAPRKMLTFDRDPSPGEVRKEAKDSSWRTGMELVRSNSPGGSIYSLPLAVNDAGNAVQSKPEAAKPEAAPTPVPMPPVSAQELREQEARRRAAAGRVSAEGQEMAFPAGSRKFENEPNPHAVPEKSGEAEEPGLVSRLLASLSKREDGGPVVPYVGATWGGGNTDDQAAAIAAIDAKKAEMAKAAQYDPTFNQNAQGIYRSDAATDAKLAGESPWERDARRYEALRKTNPDLITDEDTASYRRAKAVLGQATKDSAEAKKAEAAKPAEPKKDEPKRGKLSAALGAVKESTGSSGGWGGEYRPVYMQGAPALLPVSGRALGGSMIPLPTQLGISPTGGSQPTFDVLNSGGNGMDVMGSLKAHSNFATRFQSDPAGGMMARADGGPIGPDVYVPVVGDPETDRLRIGEDDRATFAPDMSMSPAQAALARGGGLAKAIAPAEEAPLAMRIPVGGKDPEKARKKSPDELLKEAEEMQRQMNAYYSSFGGPAVDPRKDYK